MADNIGIAITGDLRLGLKFDEFPEALRAQLLQQIGEIVEQLAAGIRSDVPHKTGSLESKIAVQVYNNEHSVAGRVFFTGEYAKAGELEYGGTGKAFKVAAHQMRLDHVFSNRLAAPLNVFVSAHSRALHNIGQRFVRGPASSMRDAIEAELQQTVDSKAEAF